MIDYEVSPQFEGGVGEKISVVVLNPHKFVSVDGLVPYPPNTYVSQAKDPISGSREEDLGFSLMEWLINLFIGAMIVLAISIGGSMAHTWVLFNTLQLWFVSGLMDLVYPASIQLAMRCLDIANFENPVLSGITQTFLPDDYFVDEPFNERFEALGFGNSYFISNMADVIPTLVAGLTLFVVVVTLHVMGKVQQSNTDIREQGVNKRYWVFKAGSKVMKRMRWNYFI